MWSRPPLNPLMPCSFGADHMGCLAHLEHDYHVSFTPKELAKGEVYYNYRMTDGGMEA
jgi:predicted dithiol-disulfide oxidoreductase (DUF899 family)